MKYLTTILLAWVLACAPALAHQPSDSYLNLEILGDRIEGRWDIALRDLDHALHLDDGDGQLTWDEVRRRHPEIAAYALSRLKLGGAREDSDCATAATTQLIDRHSDGAYTVLQFTVRCPAAIDALQVDYRLFADLDPQHRGLLQVKGHGQRLNAILGGDQATRTFTLTASGSWGAMVDYVKHGVWHIWIGFDHILFLVSLLLPAVLVRRPDGWEGADGFRSSSVEVLKVVTAFTAAHSITLSCAALGLVALPSRWVESAIAASVAIASLNNLFPIVQGRRWVAAFVFGLLHGFGFASVLGDLGLPPGAMAASLFGFNLGVELGQLAIVAAFLPLAYLVRSTWFYRRVVLGGGSVAALLLALAWFTERAFDVRLAG
jgi:hypothetical protein